MELKEFVYNKLDELGVEYSIINHKAMFSEQDTNFEEFDNDITIGKNLFLRNDTKKKYYLILIPLVKRVKKN